MTFYCYLIVSNNKTYIGYTNNLKNRIKKHNQIIKGGAKCTRTSKNWSYHTIIGNFKNKSDAMSFEWYWKHSYFNNKWNKTRPSIVNKMKRLIELLIESRWKHINIIIQDKAVLA
jgi:predicted GIY-YIG superfamily endonuclease